jgi:tetratricopeptide (TPR) repeat protein
MTTRPCFLIATLALGAAALGLLPGALAQPLPSETERARRIQKYEEITASNPRDVEMWHILAGLYGEAEEWDKAISAESKALAIHPKYAVAYHGRGRARMGKQDYSGAIDDFSAAIKLWEMRRGGLQLYLTEEQPKEEYIDCYRSRGVSLAHLNRYNDGIEDVSTALKLRRDNDARLHFERGHLEEKVGRKTDAIADFQRAGLLYADRGARQPAEECAARLESLGAGPEAASVRRKLTPARPKSDLP